MRHIFILSAVFLLPILCGGCGKGTPAFNKSTVYTSESLAQELIFRFKELSGVEKKVTSKAGRGKAAAPLSEKEQKKAGESKKEALATTADTIVDDVASKIRLIPGSPAESCKKVAEAIRKDADLDPKDREQLANRIDAMAKEL